MLNLKTVLRSNTVLKIKAIIISFFIWSILSDSLTITKWLTIPVCFYNVKDICQISSPNTVTIKLQGKKSALSLLNKNNTSIYINGDNLKPGQNPYTITEQDLFLPSNISIVDYKPHQIIINYKQIAT